MKQYWHTGNVTEQLTSAMKIGLALLVGSAIIGSCERLTGLPKKVPLDLTPTENPEYSSPQFFVDKGININVQEYKKGRYVIFKDYNFDGNLDAVELVRPLGNRVTLTNNLSAWTNGYERAKICVGAKTK